MHVTISKFYILFEKQWRSRSLSYNLSLSHLFCLFLSGRFTQALLNAINWSLEYIGSTPIWLGWYPGWSESSPGFTCHSACNVLHWHLTKTAFFLHCVCDMSHMLRLPVWKISDQVAYKNLWMKLDSWTFWCSKSILMCITFVTDQTAQMHMLILHL